MLSRLTIVTLVRVQLLLLSALLIFVLGLNFWQTIKTRNVAHHMGQVIEAVDLMLDATEELARERLATSIVGAAPLEERADLLAEVELSSEKITTQVETAIALLHDIGVADKEGTAALLEDVQMQLAAHDEGREEFHAFLLANEDLGRSAPRRWNNTSFETLKQLGALVDHVENGLRVLDPLVAQQIALRQNTFMLWELALREQAAYQDALLSSYGLLSLDLGEIRNLHGQINVRWERLQRMAATSVAADKLEAALQAATTEYMERYFPRAEHLLMERHSVEISFDDYQALSEPVIASLSEIRELALAITRDVIETRLSDANRTMIIQAILSLIAVSLVVLAFIVMQRRLAQPVTELTGTINRISAGDLEAEVTLRDRKDEVGSIARALEELRQEGLRARAAEEERRKEQEKQLERAQMIARLTSDFDAAVSASLDTTVEIAAAVNESATRLHETSDGVLRQSEMVDQAADQATHNVQTVASASEELAASIREINQQIEQSLQLSEEAVQKARDTSGLVSTLSESAERIDTVRQLITDIAEKTNLLALNAAIEAARAGEAGKGFNVVASEVKDLAKQTADATQEIDRQIRAMELCTRDVVSGTKTIESFISRVNEAITTIASASEEQSAATQEISNSVQEAASGTQQVSSGMNEVRQAAENTNGMASDMLKLSQELRREGQQLGEQVKEFLTKVREA